MFELRCSAEVSDIRLFGVDYKGDLLWTPENSTWQNRVNCTEEKTPFVRSGSVRIEAGGSATVLDGVLLLPQPVTEDVAVTFKYAYEWNVIYLIEGFTIPAFVNAFNR